MRPLCNFSTGETEAGGSLALTGQSTQPGSARDLVLKHKVESKNLGHQLLASKILDINFWPLHSSYVLCTVTDTHALHSTGFPIGHRDTRGSEELAFLLSSGKVAGWPELGLQIPRRSPEMLSTIYK